ncbi:MAG TPA: hypothetical protein DEA97_13035 [Bacteroidales bacterium]|nr:hypothetical protein [Bacteroidales bacterium]
MKKFIILVFLFFLETNSFSQCQQIIMHYECLSHEITDNAIYVCQGDTIIMNAWGEYPENDTYYHQDDATSQFVWMYKYHTDAVYRPDDPIWELEFLFARTVFTDTSQLSQFIVVDDENFNIGLNILDIDSCLVSNNGLIHARVLKSPVIEITEAPDTVIVGDSCLMTATFSANPFREYSGGGFGNTIPPEDLVTVEYSHMKQIDFFEDDDIIDSIGEIEQICVILEHSYLGDLIISLTCPWNINTGNPETLTLQYYGGGSAYLGEPVFDPGYGWGTGYDYCWSPIPDFSTMTSEASSESLLPPGNYTAYESFSKLIGCKKNGFWSFHILDNWWIDDGYVFDWDINFIDGLKTIYNYEDAIIGNAWSGAEFSNPESLSTNVYFNEPGEQEILFNVFTENCAFSEVEMVVVLDTALSVSNAVSENIQIFPNPANNFLKIKTDQKINYTVYNYIGEVLLIGENTLVDISRLSSGVYLIKLRFENGKEQIFKFVKN